MTRYLWTHNTSTSGIATIRSDIAHCWNGDNPRWTIRSRRCPMAARDSQSNSRRRLLLREAETPGCPSQERIAHNVPRISCLRSVTWRCPHDRAVRHLDSPYRLYIENMHGNMRTSRRQSPHLLYRFLISWNPGRIHDKDSVVYLELMTYDAGTLLDMSLLYLCT